jgi:putative ABC transport system permease protein
MIFPLSGMSCFNTGPFLRSIIGGVSLSCSLIVDRDAYCNWHDVCEPVRSGIGDHITLQLNTPSMLNEFKFAFRRLAKSPGFTAVAIITLALGIGANAVMYSMVRDMVLRSLARDKQHHLVAVYTSRLGPNPDYRMFSYAEYSAVRESKEVFSDIAAMCFDVGAIGPRDTLRRSLICFVSENYFRLLGIHPFAGRFFSTSEAKADAGIPVVVASYEFWKIMGKAPDFVGSKIEIDRKPFTVIGISPEGFGGLHTSISPDVWLPLGVISPAFGHAQLRDAHAYRLGLIASLHPDLTMDLARSRISAVEGRMNAVDSSDEPRKLLLAPPPRFSLWESAPNDESVLSLFAGLAMGLSATVLLVACLNLANLLLARGTARQKEIAICLSIGATRTQIVRQLLVEGLVLAIGGGALGLLLCQWCGNLFQGYARSSFSEGTFNLTTQPPLDISVVAGAFVLSLAATAVFSLAPALRATRVNPVDDLKQQPGEPARGGRWNHFFSFRHCLVMVQIALSLMLLFSAGLFIRGSIAASRRYPGFQTVDGIAANLDYSFSGLSADAILSRQQAVLGQVSSMPGVARAAMASSVPFNFESSYQRVFTYGEKQSNGADDKVIAAAPYAATTLVTNGYFQTLGIPILRGR